MKNLIIISFILVLGIAFSQNCTVSNDDREDCGYTGINQQQCQAKGCCWDPVNQAEELFLPQPTQLQVVPWCFFPAGQNICHNLSYNANNPGFDNIWYQEMYQNMLQNIDIDLKGGIAILPDYNVKIRIFETDNLKTYDLMRVESLTMRTLQEINDFDISKYQTKMNDWVQWVIRTMSEPDPNGIDVRVEPKFNLPNGDIYSGGWCRPQTDGPGLRATALIMYAKTLIQNGQQSYVNQYLWTGNQNNYNGGAIKFHLDWVAANWQSNGCDIWEEVQSNDFFWNRMAFVHALNLGVLFANQMGDSSSAGNYQSALNAIKPTVQNHYQGSYIYESTNRMKDSAVIHAIVSFNDDQFSLQGPEIAGTIKVLNNLFCETFPINSKDTLNGIPGILYGRYQGDTQNGGNPWQLLTSALGELYYQGAVSILTSRDHNELITDDEFNNWKDILNLTQKPTVMQFAETSVQAGDSILNRIYNHVKNDNFIIYEQLNKFTGAQLSGKSLTWSYANILSALHLRNKSLSQFPFNPEQ